MIAELLELDGITSTITDNVEEGIAEGASFDMITINLLRWRMIGERFDAEREAGAMSLSPRGQDGLVEHLARGRGILAMHTAAISFDDWPEWGEIVGARWNWHQSSHPPPRPSVVHVRAGAHPIVAGVADFEVVDEIYSFLDYHDVDPLMTSPRRGIEQPLLWARAVGGGRVVYDALGHDQRSIGEPSHARIIRGAAAWALAGEVEPPVN
jgi:hypothetical protein